MKIAVYDSVPNKQRIEEAVDFGMRHIDMAINPKMINLEHLSIRVYGSDCISVKGDCVIVGNYIGIRVFALAHETENDLLRTIFHEIAHLKQYIKDGDAENMHIHKNLYEVDADWEADFMLMMFLQKEALKQQLK